MAITFERSITKGCGVPQLPTIEDVALAARVSRQTVSNVINSPDIVRPETRERVQKAITSLGYRPHASARRLRTRKSSTIGIRLDPETNGISGSVLDRFLHALTEQAEHKNLRVLLFTASDPEEEIAQFARLSDGADVDAFVLTSTFHNDPRITWLLDNKHTFVTFGRPWGADDMATSGHRWVDVDGYSGLYDSTVHRLQQGHTRVGYIGWPGPSGTGEDRRRGWLQAMTENSGLALPEITLLETSATDEVSRGEAAMLELMSFPGGVDAVVCASDTLALGAILASSGSIPVSGYDNTPTAAALGFTSVAQPLGEVAARALDLLTSGNSVAPNHHLIRPDLVVRRAQWLLPRVEVGG
ncbi:LacI family DNA-binding transcriptional regulator [Lysinibacter sp. HNR]|uniref:LacI family DNA-binding transcriptional regulator n=1 Tax=Lysinibacter sp. HNR TaxID=3031408 RepID=UPI00243580DC|nr:LacI family DNA-binding transcriptional regulator [Lysinibacter sp. HNR]WGD37498.1 LacI family DNA-binding transcriptional regulator [Lysinibacter sp. HNR]